MAAWATIEETQTATGVTVTDALLARAQATVEVFTGRTFDETTQAKARDLGWLRYAVAHQAAWLTAQPDAAQRMDLTEIIGSGSATSTQALTPTGMVLAPMARWSLRRVSWLRSRSVHVRSPFLDSPPTRRGSLTDAWDDDAAWTPIGGG